MSCPCGLTKGQVLLMADKHGIRLTADGRCRNGYADNSNQQCGRLVGSHPDMQPGNKLFYFIIHHNLVLIILFYVDIIRMKRVFWDGSSIVYSVEFIWLSLEFRFLVPCLLRQHPQHRLQSPVSYKKSLRSCTTITSYSALFILFFPFVGHQ